jgi:pimeloyl-ACP methyl ester carboxylesterase
MKCPNRTNLVLIAACAALVSLASAATNDPGSQSPLVIAKEGWMYIGGHLETIKGKQYMTGQMYVEYQFPAKKTHPYPVIFVHSGLSGVFWTGTPDGREGWAQYFLRHGYDIYVIDQPGRGRSRYIEDSYGPLAQSDATHALGHFVRQEQHIEGNASWPQANLHTQWPGTGDPEEAASQQVQQAELQEINTNKKLELTTHALIALVDKLGPSILLAASEATVYAWSVADARPNLVKAVVAAGPSGPPAHRIEFIGPPDYFKYGDLVRPWGLSRAPLAYSPPVNQPSELSFVQEDKADGPGLVRCYMQKEPVRRLSNLEKVPVAIVSPEASDHAPYDHCTAKYLNQAGVKTTYFGLAGMGIHGNGDSLMWEKNNQEIAGILAKWLDTTVTPPARAK